MEATVPSSDKYVYSSFIAEWLPVYYNRTQFLFIYLFNRDSACEWTSP